MFTVSSCAPRCCGTADDTAGTDVNVLRRVARASAFFARASVDRMNSCSHTAHGIKAACEHKFIRSTPATRRGSAEHNRSVLREQLPICVIGVICGCSAFGCEPSAGACSRYRPVRHVVVEPQMTPLARM